MSFLSFDFLGNIFLFSLNFILFILIVLYYKNKTKNLHTNKIDNLLSPTLSNEELNEFLDIKKTIKELINNNQKFNNSSIIKLLKLPLEQIELILKHKKTKQFSIEHHEIISYLLNCLFFNLNNHEKSNNPSISSIEEYKHLLKTLISFGYSPDGEYIDFSNYTNIKSFTKETLTHQILKELSKSQIKNNLLENNFIQLIDTGFLDIYQNKNQIINTLINSNNRHFVEKILFLYPASTIKNYFLTEITIPSINDDILKQILNKNHLSDALKETNKNKKIFL